MQRALVAALLVGAVAPLVGVFLVQRRLALIGDGMGHVALAGVAVGVLTGSSPVWAALVAALVAAVVVELIRTSGHSQGDVALAIIFYGGIAASVVIISASPKGTPGTLTAYLFGAITTVTQSDLWIFGALTALILVTFALMFVVLAMAMFGLFELSLPAGLQTRLTAASGRRRSTRCRR